MPTAAVAGKTALLSVVESEPVHTVVVLGIAGTGDAASGIKP